MARKPKHEEHENHERWLISYADFITLLFAFFVVMYAVSSVNEGKYRVLSDALVAAFRSSARSMEPIQMGELSKATDKPSFIKGISTKSKEAIIHQERIVTPIGRDNEASSNREKSGVEDGEQGEGKSGAAAIKVMADKLEAAMAGLIKQDLIAVRRNALWVEVEIKTSILFPSGSAKLQDEALPILSEIARILNDFPNPIRVEGFTDTVPINTLAFPSNWELSAGRAASVVHLFAREGLDPRRMAATGFGEYHPIAENSTAEGRNMNRRVVVLILEGADAERILSGGRAAAGNANETQGNNNAEEPPAIDATVDAAAAAAPGPEK